MTPATRNTVVTVGLALLAWTTSSSVQAQICNGTPRNGGLDYEFETRGVGSSQGAGLTLAASHFAWNAAYHHSTLGPNLSMHTGETRFSIPLGTERLTVCPGLGFQFDDATWNASAADTLTALTATGRAGVSLGFGAFSRGGFQLIPFAGADYSYAARFFSLKAGNAKNTVSGDTLSHVELNYGVIFRYDRIFAGLSSRMRTSDGAAYLTVWKAGFSF